MKTRRSRAMLAAAAVGLICSFTAVGGAAFAAPAAGIKGDPQPELGPFKIGPSDGAGSVALEPDGAIVVAYDISAGDGKTQVCVLDRGSHTCSTKATLSPLDGDRLYGPSEVFVPSANHVSVVQYGCCSDPTAGEDLLWTSTNGGKTFGKPVPIGTVGLGAAALVGDDIVFAAIGRDGALVQSVPVDASGPPAESATAITEADYDIGAGYYKNGALIAGDYLGDGYTTRVAYAPAGKNFNASSSYHSVGTFPDEQLVGISGDALLTENESTKGNDALELRIFNGSSFGSAHTVPHLTGGGSEWFAIDRDPGGHVHVFSESTHLSPIYNLFDQTTSTGASWSTPLDLGSAVDNSDFAVALDANGSGLVLGTSPATGYPVLAGQSVTFKLSRSSIRKGHTVTGSGKGSPAASGREVELQREKSGLWYTVATTHENSSGSFSFSIKGTSTGTFDYRAVAADLAGYVLYGYSSSQSLKVTS
jgi:hypothetical protein